MRSGGASFVWVKRPGGDERRAVEPGLANSRFIRILSGLKVGEEVSLAPPLVESSAGLETKLVPSEEEREGEAE